MWDMLAAYTLFSFILTFFNIPATPLSPSSEEEVMEMEEDTCCSDYLDATTLISGLIGELSSLKSVIFLLFFNLILFVYISVPLKFLEFWRVLEEMLLKKHELLKPIILSSCVSCSHMLMATHRELENLQQCNASSTSPMH